MDIPIIPDVSVVIATRNRPDFLRDALQAIFSQTADVSVEAIVVFDQSEVDTALLDEFPGQAVRVMSNTRHPGLAGARNTGTLASEARWVAFCDDDDMWLPDKLERQLALAADDPTAYFLTGGLLIDHPGGISERPHESSHLTHADLLHSRVAQAHPSTFLMKREEFLDEVGLMDEELFGGHATDYDLLLRYSAIRDVRAVVEPVVKIRMHPVSYFTSKWEMKIPALDRLLAKYPEFADDPVGLARIRGQRAFALASSGRRREGLREGMTVLRLNWRERRAWLAFAVGLGLLKPATVVRVANKRGRGI
jgi:glycosyltransferase involved in cell wall biosynthesis